MKISKLFHWLYAFLMFLPFIGLPFNLLRVSLSGSFELLETADILGLLFFPSFEGLSYQIEMVYYYLLSNIFGLSNPILYMVIQSLTYWTIISIAYLIFDVIMYVPLLVHRWLDKARLE